MTRHSAAAESTRMLAERTGTDPRDWYLVFKARYGMQVVFRALVDERGPGDVVTQVFTCATAVDPILAAGLHPVYAEVSPATVAIDPDRLAVGAATRGVVLQHTFGIVDHAAALRVRDAAVAAGAVLVEDSAHCVGRMARDGDGAPVADVSIHSFGVEKMLRTRFGGAVWVNPAMCDGVLRARIAADLASLPVVGRRLDLVARLYRDQVRVLNRLPARIAARLRATLTRLRAFEPPIAPVERRGGLPYAPMRPSPWMVAEIARGLPSLADTEARRTGVVAEYVRALADVVEVPAAVGAGCPLVRFPFFTPDAATAEHVIAALAAAGFYPGRWYRPALFPGVDDPAAYGYAPGDGTLATTEDLIARVVNLPTAVELGEARRIAGVVRAAIG
jgi:dTDP-4-amino-4,6-dideoxygalactose transaminase